MKRGNASSVEVCIEQRREIVAQIAQSALNKAMASNHVSARSGLLVACPGRFFTTCTRHMYVCRIEQTLVQSTTKKFPFRLTFSLPPSLIRYPL